jgi:hypothetical protein
MQQFNIREVESCKEDNVMFEEDGESGAVLLAVEFTLLTMTGTEGSFLS